MTGDFAQQTWDATLEDDCRQIVRLAVREDLDRFYDWTTCSLVPHEAQGKAVVVARQAGVVAGLHAARVTLEEMAPAVTWTTHVADGASVPAGTAIAHMAGPARDLLTCERIVLNFLGRLCGIASLTRRFVEQVVGTQADVYDTRKTTPGWRRLEKYAVRCGGGHNHRTGLFDAVLIKDNHLMVVSRFADAALSPGDAVRRARDFVAEIRQQRDRSAKLYEDLPPLPIEVEVDSLQQLVDVLSASPDIVLLDNMNLEQLREGVFLRNKLAAGVILEASGGVRLETIAAIAATGVNRISAGALTHSAIALDVALDWE